MSPRPTPPRVPTHFAAKLYRFGLLLYPRAYRRRYGPEMELLFRDLWRDARATRSLASVLKLVLRTATDLIGSAFRERLASLRHPMNPPKTMSPRARLGWSLGAGLPVAAAIVGLSIVVTLALPKTYLSSAKVLVRHRVDDRSAPTSAVAPFDIHDEMEIATSIDVLSRVIDKLSLNDRWSGKYLGNGTLQTPETLAILRDKVSVRQFRNVPMLEVRVHDTDRQVAADIANAIAETYTSLRRAPTPSLSAPPQPGDGPRIGASIVDVAEPGLRPVRPNLPLNVFVGLLGGGFVGTTTAGLVWLVLRRRSRTFAPSPAAPAR